MPPANVPGPQEIQFVVAKLYPFRYDPGLQAVHTPVLDCPGRQGQFSAVAQVSVVAPLKEVKAAGMLGQLYTSFCHSASAFKDVH